VRPNPSLERTSTGGGPLSSNVERLLSSALAVGYGSRRDRQLSKLIAVKQPVNFRFPKTAFR
jgi:hypothetical protein